MHRVFNIAYLFSLFVVTCGFAMEPEISPSPYKSPHSVKKTRPLGVSHRYFDYNVYTQERIPDSPAVLMYKKSPSVNHRGPTIQGHRNVLIWAMEARDGIYSGVTDFLKEEETCEDRSSLAGSLETLDMLRQIERRTAIAFDKQTNFEFLLARQTTPIIPDDLLRKSLLVPLSEQERNMIREQIHVRDKNRFILAVKDIFVSLGMKVVPDSIETVPGHSSSSKEEIPPIPSVSRVQGKGGITSGELPEEKKSTDAILDAVSLLLSESGQGYDDDDDGYFKLDDD